MTLISLAVLNNTTIPPGTCVVLTTVGEATVRPFDSAQDSVEDIVGVVYPSRYTSGRADSVDGPVHYSNSVFQYNEDLSFTIQGNAYVYNPTYDSEINPSDTTQFATVQVNGYAAVLKTATIPPQWIKIGEGVEFDNYIICL